MFETVVTNFNDTLDATTRSLESLVPAIVEASGMMVQTLLQENKIIACAGGGASFIANRFAACMLNRYEHERPSLPALSLCNDTDTFAAISRDAGLAEAFAKPVRALGQPGDILLVATDTDKNKSLIQAVQAAHDRDMRVIALTAGDDGDIPSLLLAEDLELRAPAANKARTLELQLLIIHCCCDLVDKQLFGG